MKRKTKTTGPKIWPMSETRKAMFERLKIDPDLAQRAHEKMELATVAEKDEWGKARDLPYNPCTIDQIEQWGTKFLEKYFIARPAEIEAISNAFSRAFGAYAKVEEYCKAISMHVPKAEALKLLDDAVQLSGESVAAFN